MAASDPEYWSWEGESSETRRGKHATVSSPTPEVPEAHTGRVGPQLGTHVGDVLDSLGDPNEVRCQPYKLRTTCSPNSLSLMERRRTCVKTLLDCDCIRLI